MRPIPGGRAWDGYADDSNLEGDRPSLARKLASPGRGSSRQAPPGRPPIGRSFGTSMSEDLGQILRSQSVTSKSECVRLPFRDALHPRCDHRVDLSLGVPPLRQHQRALVLLSGLNCFAFGCHPHIRNADFARFRSLLQWLLLMMRAWPGEDSASQNPGLWKGAKRISTRRAGGVDPGGWPPAAGSCGKGVFVEPSFGHLNRLSRPRDSLGSPFFMAMLRAMPVRFSRCFLS